MYFGKMSAKVLNVAYVADDVITLSEIFYDEKAIPLQKLLLFCKLWQFCLKIITFYIMSPRCVRFFENAQENLHMFLHLHEAGYIREYRHPVSIEEYENIGKLTSLFCCPTLVSRLSCKSDVSHAKVLTSVRMVSGEGGKIRL